MQIIKRDGRECEFDKNKIVNAIKLASVRTEVGFDEELANKIADSISKVEKSKIHISEVENMVENKLMASSRKDIAREYITYRRQRTEERLKQTDVYKFYTEIINVGNEEILKENGNLNGQSFSGKKTKVSSENDKWYALNFIMPKHVAKAHKEGYVHQHDLDWWAYGTHNCSMIDLPEMLSHGFSTGNGSVRVANSISTAFSLVAIIFQSVQNCQFGGVGSASTDKALAPFVDKSFKKYFKRGLEYFDESDCSETEDDIFYGNQFLNGSPLSYNFAMTETKRETMQGAESLVHNLNTMNSRSGSQTPFSSINYGLDNTPQGRLVIESILRASIAGLGNGETPIFPIQIFSVLDGVNKKQGDLNYDMFQLAIECSSKRLFPNFSNISAPYNLQYYDENDYRTVMNTMGCRTRVIGDRFGKNRSTGKGNLAFSTLNLPLIAIESTDTNDFKNNILKNMQISLDGLMSRYELQSKQKAKGFDFVMREGVWEGGETLNPNESVGELLKHGTVSIGFCGLAEALKFSMGHHHGESEEAQKFGLEIISMMRKFCDDKSNELNFNISLFATPAESLAGRFAKINTAKHGSIEGVTDKDYITNSSHVPVYYQLPAHKKIEVEAPYHELCNAGHIGYVELDGNARNNLQAFEKVVQYALDKNMTYFSINHPIDMCPNCNFEGVIGFECPNCHITEDSIIFNRYRRLTGYLTGTLDRWNSAKRAEEKDRVKHG